MRILIVNPNTDESVTATIAKQAEKSAGDNTEIISRTAPSGPQALVTAEDSRKAGPIVASVISEHAHEIDGAVISAYSDPGLSMAREVHTFPIVGIAEASMKEAGRLGRHLVIIASNASSEGTYRQYAKMHGVDDKLENIRFVEKSALSDGHDVIRENVAELCRRAVVEDGADVIVIAGGHLVGVADDVASVVDIPVLDCVGCAIQRVERWVTLGSPD